MSEKNLVPPQININGTSRRELVQQQLDVLRTLRALQQAMVDAMPNGRDYQIRPSEAPAARAAWMDRIAIIYEMTQEIEKHAMAIQDGGP